MLAKGFRTIVRTACRTAAPAVMLCALLSSAAAQTTANTPARLKSFSKLPDWSGVWRLKGSPALLDVENGPAFVPGVRDHPPYNAEWEAKYRVDLIRAEHQGDANYPNPLVDTHTVYCAAGMPHIIGTPFDYEFIVTPEKTWITVDKETRHIYTDGRGFPPEDELWPTLLGRSIGHWEGQTLVVETISVKSGIWADFTPAMLSEQAHFTERIRQIDANTLEDQVSITDPTALTKPWNFTKHYQRMKPSTWVAEPEVCGGPDDRNPIVNGRVTVVLPPAK
ncbi:MAG TPA: hypothetical protein VLY24_26310 [Bryobacteraceae bacterium]|nr:hypothetical protein [Bryobacteraceae bacterium]